MMENGEKDKLLEYIFKQQNCNDYISQLRYPGAILYIMDDIKEIEKEDYTLEQWSYFLSHVAGRKFKVEDYSSVKSFLKYYELLYLCKENFFRKR